MSASGSGGDAVFGGYTAAELEAQYNNRAAVPEHPQHIAGWAERSAAARARLPCQLDLAYGEGARQTLDLFPAARLPAPLLIYLHGGYWQALSKDYFSFVATPYVAHGVNVAVLNYSLCPAVRLEDIQAEVRLACAWLWRRAQRNGFDPRRIQALGHSAGGHLAAMLAATDWPALDPQLPGDLLHSAAGVSGLYELEPLVHTSVNAALGLSPAEARRNSPLALVPRGALRVLLAVGERESAEYHRQTDALGDAWRARGTPVDTLEIAGADHFTILEQLATEAGHLFEASVELLRSGR